MNTQSLDTVRKRLKAEGYTFTTKGRGQSYTLTITAEPPPSKVFVAYCKEQYHLPPQTDFVKFRYFVKNCLNIPNFSNYQANEIQQIMTEQGQNIDTKTIESYKQILLEQDLLVFPPYSFVYSVFDNDLKKNKYISREEYAEFWKFFYRAGKDESKVQQFMVKHNYGCYPRKKQELTTTAFSYEEYQRLEAMIEAIEQEEREQQK